MNHERFSSIMLSERLPGSRKFRQGAGGGGVLILTTFFKHQRNKQRATRTPSSSNLRTSIFKEIHSNS